MATKAYEAKVLEMLGDPKRVARELRAFREDAELLFSRYEDLLHEYPQEWIGFYRGEVAAHAATLPSLVRKLRRAGVPPGRSLVRFLDQQPRKMIL